MTDPKDPEIQTLAELLGFDPTNPKNIPEDPAAWRDVKQAPAHSCLGPVKMPNMHLSHQVAWLHDQMRKWKARSERQIITRMLRRARAAKRKAKDTPERRELLRLKRNEYMRKYRRNRKLDRLRMRGEKLSREDERQVREHRRRSLLLKKKRDQKRRRELRRLYLDSLIRDSKRGGVKDPSNHVFIIDTPADKE